MAAKYMPAEKIAVVAQQANDCVGKLMVDFLSCPLTCEKSFYFFTVLPK